ncbi:mediator of RNA polymerase II transcription subunit 18 [Metschnikowia bicuspidata var. bicuspidata NRRL YB-4993]|uniref:Mediator of RNA polymerase II transcription subunit 18 n=1 Tax=Metschnikowia bicuspidata var. bicuspidata NRRL YB-4993 TaxID=869754 RepID=A0A1A0HIC1_9ASCO|nr:mediator of RNA polymerase II transcription subunit 18 [Metschnikowia bicuspidata var. bicuspidata NRRL YB-4993]OBA23632.1 mediator of RNA polymerase II transcription subunit 18 [Metschnikowia bicuspidata var. bicuspidata NRRL YB-4993]
MGHQLLLTSCIPHNNFTQTVATLQALTGSRKPQTINTYTLLTRPRNVFKPKFEPGKVNQIEQFYMKCTTVWDDDAAQRLDIAAPILKDSSDINVDRLFAGKEVKHWTLQISDIPNAGKNQVSAQNFYESTVVHHHTIVKEGPPPGAAAKDNTPSSTQRENALGTNPHTESAPKHIGPGSAIDDAIEVVPADSPELPASNEQTSDKPAEDVEMTEAPGNPAETKDSFLQFLEDLGYGVVNQYWTKGIRFFQGDIVIEIFKVLIRDDDAPFQESKIKLQPLDESNAFQIKAYISFPKGTSVDIINKRTKDLTSLQATLHNLFDLKVPDRMCMDSRVARSQ